MAFKPINILINAKDNASAVFDGLSSKIKLVAAGIAAAFGVQAFAGVVKGAADLEEGLSRVQAATGATADDMARLRKAAEDAGATTQFTATEAAGALENLAKAGLNVEQSMAALPGTLALAAAGSVDLGRSSEIVTKIVMGMGLSFSDTAKVADVLAKGANATNTSVDGLAQALSYAAPVAQSLGLSLESTVAIIGKFADAGIDASRAGTALNSVLSQFANPASKFRDELAAAGITTNSFEDALHQLAAAGPRGEKAINAIGMEAGPALRALLNQGMGALDGLKKELDGAAGSAKTTADVIQNNLNGSVKGFGSVWDTVKNALGTPVLPVLKEGIDNLAISFRTFVADGTVGKLGDAIAKTFDAGIKWVQQFITSFDFDALSVKIQTWSTEVGAAFTDFGNKATAAGGLAQAAYGVISAGANGVMVPVYLLGGAFTRLLEIVSLANQKVLEFFSSISFGDMSDRFKEAADRMRIETEGLGAAAEALEAKARESFGAMTDAAQTARDGYEKFNGIMAESGKVASDTADVYRKLNAAADEGQRQWDAAATSNKKATASVAEHKAAVAELNAKYQEAVSAGNVQRMGELQEQIRKATQATTAAFKDQGAAANDAAKQVEAAFGRLGVTSAAALKEAAGNALRDFETIRAAGTSTPEDIANAWRAYADKAIAANKGVADSALKAQGGMYGFKDAANAAGQSSFERMQKSADATSSVGDAARDAAAGYGEMGRAAEDAGNKAEKAAEKQKNAAVRTDNMGHESRSAGGLDWTGVWNDFKARGVDDETARKMADDFFGPNGESIYFNNPGMKKYGGSTDSEARGRAVAQYFRSGQDKVVKAEQEQKAAKEQAAKAPATAAPAPTATTTRTTQTVVVNITLEQTKHTISTDPQGKQAVEALLKQLGYAAKVSQ